MAATVAPAVTTSTPPSCSLADWISNGDSAGILDTRPMAHWLSYRIQSSCSIPLEQVAARSFELPDHHRSFAVISLPCDHDKVVSLLKLWTNIHIFVMKHDHIYTIPTTTTTTTASSSLSSHESLLSDPFWQCAHELRAIDYGSSMMKPAISSLMFAPCSLLSDSITTIERLLLTRDRPSPATPSAAAVAPSSNELHWRAIDLGCGAGRDVIYLARRSLASSSSSSSSSLHDNTISPWHVVALDQAIDRCETTSISHGVSSRVTCVRARFKTDGTFIMMPPVDDIKLAAKRRTSSHNNTSDDTKATPTPNGTSSSSSLSSIASSEAIEPQGALMADGRRMRLANSKPRKKDKSLKPSQAPKSSTSSGGSSSSSNCDDALAAESPLIAPIPSYDLVLMIRFLERALLPRMRSMVRLGGFVCIANFMVGCESFGHPRDPHHILQHGELATFFSDTHGFTVIKDERVIIADGRPMNHFLAQRTSYPSAAAS